MDFNSMEFLSALLAIVVIDLVLAGDNAIVIALAARSLSAALQKKAIIRTCLDRGTDDAARAAAQTASVRSRWP